MSNAPRGVVESDRFRRELDALIPDARWADEVLEGVKWTLASTPTAGVQIPDTELWVYPAYPWPGAQGIVVYYTFDARNVTLESVLREPPQL